MINKKIIAVSATDINNKLFFQNRVEAQKLGYKTSAIGVSIKTGKDIHKGYFWFYTDEYTDSEYYKRVSANLETKKRKPRKLFSKLYKNCSICKIEKDWKQYSNCKKYGKSSRCSECMVKKVTKWVKNNRNKVNKKQREMRKNPIKKLRYNLGNRVGRLIRNKFKFRKTPTIMAHLGCTIEELKKYLESKFTEGMTWDNYGKWHVDHIYPLSRAKTEEDVCNLSHYTNLQPLWAIDNIKKGNKLAKEFGYFY